MGGYLKQFFGDAYYALGFAFNQGRRGVYPELFLGVSVVESAPDTLLTSYYEWYSVPFLL